MHSVLERGRERGCTVYYQLPVNHVLTFMLYTCILLSSINYRWHHISSSEESLASILSGYTVLVCMCLHVPLSLHVLLSSGLGNNGTMYMYSVLSVLYLAELPVWCTLVHALIHVLIKGRHILLISFLMKEGYIKNWFKEMIIPLVVLGGLNFDNLLQFQFC